MSQTHIRTTRSPLRRHGLDLASNQLGTGKVIAFVVAAAAPLTVVAGGATTGYQVAQVLGIPIAYVAVALVLALFTVGYVAMARHVTNPGAFYSYAAHGLGRTAGVATGMVAVLAYGAMQIGLYGGIGVVTAGYADARLGIVLPWWVWAGAAWVLVGVLGALKIEANSRVLVLLLVLETLVVVVFDAAILAHPADGYTIAGLDPSHLFSAGAGAALIIAVTGFVGFEATAVFAREAKDPRRTVPRATYLAVTTVGVLYAVSSWAMSIGTGSDRIVAAATEHGTELLFILGGTHLGTTLVDLGHLLFVTSLFAALLSFHHIFARYTFSLARERVLPTTLGAISQSTRAPIGGSLLQTFTAFAVIVWVVAVGADPLVHLFFWGTVLGGLGVLLLMTITSAAVVGFFATDSRGEHLWRRLAAPGAAFVVLVGVTLLTLTHYSTLLGVPEDSPVAWQLPALYVVAAATGVVRALALRVTDPTAWQRIGTGVAAHPSDSDLEGVD